MLRKLGSNQEMSNLLEFASQIIFGSSHQEFLAKGRCLNCKESIRVLDLTPREQACFKLTTLCPTCYSAIAAEE